MPLRAIIAGKSLLAFEQSPEEWRLLREQLRLDRSLGLFDCCDSQVVAKRSKLGTQFFAHLAKSACEAAKETEAHRCAKRALYDACIDAGWKARMEAVAPDGSWRADVLASRQQTHVAFEVQWSDQSIERTIERHRGYALHGVRAYWLFRRLPFRTPTLRVPAFKLKVADGSLQAVSLGATIRSLTEFTRLALDEHIKFCDAVSVQREQARCRFRRTICPHCAEQVHFAEATPRVLQAVCGMAISNEPEFAAIQSLYSDWRNKLVSIYAEDLSLSSNENASVPNVLLRSPPTKPFLTAAGRSGYCPKCLKVVTITEDSNESPVVFETDAPHLAPEWPKAPFPHWCEGSNGDHCSGTGPPLARSEAT